MYKGFYDVRLRVEGREDTLLFLSESYDATAKFYCKKVNELRKDKSLEFCYENKHYYLGDFINGTYFLDDDSLEHGVTISNDMYYHDGYLYHPDGTSEEMTEAELNNILEKYIEEIS